MPNYEHLVILDQGVKVWNEWRKKNPDIKPDLMDSYLIDSWLREANFQFVDFRAANLQNAKLMGADLKCAKLQGANLQHADLRGTDLRRTDLTEADITGINLFLSAREGWQIYKIKCSYIYFDEYGKERQPIDRDFKSGEFERLYRVVPTIEFVFEQGLTSDDLHIMSFILQKIKDERQELGLTLLSFDMRTLFPRFQFSVALEKYKQEAVNELKERYEAEKRLLVEDRNRWYQFAISQQPRQIIAGNYVEAHRDIEIAIHINEAINEIKKVIENTPEEAISGNAKKKALEHLDNIGKEITKESAKAAWQKLKEYVNGEIVLKAIPQIMKVLADFNLHG